MLLNQQLSDSLGISPNEAKIYESLLETGEQSISQIAIHAKIHRRNAYDAIHRLLDKGLVFQIIDPRENKYQAVEPEKLTELLSERETELAQLLPKLQQLYHKQNIPEVAYIYRGLEGQKNIFREILRVNQDSYFLGAKGGWYDPSITAARQAFFKQANKQKIKFIQLFDFETIKKLPNFPKHFEGELQYKVLPKEYSTNSAINIFGDYVVTYTGLPTGIVPPSTIFFVLKSHDLAESYRKWFWYMWDKSSKK